MKSQKKIKSQQKKWNLKKNQISKKKKQSQKKLKSQKQWSQKKFQNSNILELKKCQGQIMSVSDNVRVTKCQDLVNVRVR